MIENYKFPPFRRDRNKKGDGKMAFIRKELLAKRLKHLETKSTETICIEEGGKMVFIRKELLAKRLKHLETKSTETICIELLIYKNKWCIKFT